MEEKKKIVVCEDDADTRQALENILTKRGYTVITASDGKECIEKVKDVSPSLLLIDIRMPKIDGVEALKRIRRFNTKLKVIFITAFESPQLSQEAGKYGIEDYLVKPPDPKHIIEAVRKALS